MKRAEPREIAKGLDETGRLAVMALCGNSWDWLDFPSPALQLVEALGLMESRQLGRKGKSSPTSLGLAVRAILENKHD